VLGILLKRRYRTEPKNAAKTLEVIPGPSTMKGRRHPEQKYSKRMFVKATILWASLKGETKTLEGRYLTNFGCSAAMLNRKLVNQEKITVIKRSEPLQITSVVGSLVKGAGEYYTPPYLMRIGSHQEEISWEVSESEEGVSGYLRMTRLALHNPDMDWEKRRIKWRSLHCKQHCLPMTSAEEVMEYVCQILKEAMPPTGSA